MWFVLTNSDLYSFCIIYISSCFQWNYYILRISSHNKNLISLLNLPEKIISSQILGRIISVVESQIQRIIIYNYEFYAGTRIVYERAFLMNLRNSPISRTPPRNTLSIPSELLKGSTPAITRDPTKNSDKGQFASNLWFNSNAQFLRIFLNQKN